KVTGLTGSWFGTVCRGIWQDVYLEGYPELSLEDVSIHTSVRKGKLEVHAIAGGASTEIEHNSGEMEQNTVQVRLVVRELGVLSGNEHHVEHAQAS
ncbi:hypothetical protein, partial [Bacillus pumilus]